MTGNWHLDWIRIRIRIRETGPDKRKTERENGQGREKSREKPRGKRREQVMDKEKKKNGGTGSSEDKDHTPQSESASPSKPKPAHIASGSGDNSDKSKAGTNSGSDKDNTPSKTHAHTPDDATKQGPQKKRRKVTHGMALISPSPPFPPSFSSRPASLQQEHDLRVHLTLAYLPTHLPTRTCGESSGFLILLSLRANPVSLAFLQHAYIAADL